MPSDGTLAQEALEASGTCSVLKFLINRNMAIFILPEFCMKIYAKQIYG